jgi:hypothetical protein
MAKIANAKYHENEHFAVLRTPDSGAKGLLDLMEN